MNLVELISDEDERKPSPCEFGTIVEGHACYCHHENGPRKCHVWSMHGDGPDGWDEQACPFFKSASSTKAETMEAKP